jgi:FixJ family two-component response regulator
MSWRVRKLVVSDLSASCAANLGKGRRAPAGPLISIIDDDDSMRNAVVALVRSAGYEARGFASAEEFLASGEVQSFACVITDIHMQGMSGIELNPDLEGKARASGAACFLRKPFDADLLIGCVESALKT